MDYTYLLSLCVILLSTKIFSLISRRAQLPQVVGALMAGLIFGPAVLGQLTNALFGVRFCLMPSPLLSRLAELGVIVLMFTAGMGTSVKDLKASGKAGFLVALLGVLTPLGMGALMLYAFEPATNLESALFLGSVLTATSVSITVEALKEINMLATKVGNTILAAALIDDILGLICLTIVSGMGGERVSLALIGVRLLGFFAFVGIAAVAYHRAMVWMDHRNAERNLRRYPVAGFAFCLFMAWTAEVVFGIADITGAFAAGMIIAMAPKGQYIASKFDTMGYLLLTPVFFANIGLEVSIPSMSGWLVFFTLVLVLVGVASKLIGCGLGAKLCGFTNRQCVQTGLGMVCRGEVALIVANKGIAMHAIHEQYLGPIIIMIIACTILSPAMLKAAFRGETSAEKESRLIENYTLTEKTERILGRLFNRHHRRQKLEDIRSNQQRED